MIAPFAGGPGGTARGVVARTTARAVALAAWVVRLASAGSAVAAGGCATRAMPRVEALAPADAMQLTASLSATVNVAPEAITLVVTGGRVALAATSARDSTALAELRDVSVRAVIVADSAGQLVPLGVSSPYLVPGSLRAGEVRELLGAEFALPVPDGVRLADTRVVFEVRGVGVGTHGGERTVTTLVCSRSTLSASPSPAALRFSERLRTNYADACRL